MITYSPPSKSWVESIGVADLFQRKVQGRHSEHQPKEAKRELVLEQWGLGWLARVWLAHMYVCLLLFPLVVDVCRPKKTAKAGQLFHQTIQHITIALLSNFTATRAKPSTFSHRCSSTAPFLSFLTSSIPSWFHRPFSLEDGKAQSLKDDRHNQNACYVYQTTLV